MLKSVLCQRVKCYKSSLHDVCSPTKFHIMRAKQNCWKKKHEGKAVYKNYKSSVRVIRSCEQKKLYNKMTSALVNVFSEEQFSFNDKKVRSFYVNGESLLIAKDVCLAVGYNQDKYRNALEKMYHLNEDKVS